MPTGPVLLDGKNAIGPHLWQIRAVQDGAKLGIILLVLWLCYTLATAIAPVLVGFLAAYFVAPALRWLERRGVSRIVVAIVTSAASVVGVVTIFVTLVPRFVQELSNLRERIPKYLGIIREQTGLDVANLWKALDMQSALDALEKVEPLLGLVQSVVGTTAYGFIFFVLSITSFVVFNLEFERLPHILRYVPKSRRKRLQPIAQVVVHVFQGFLRGQLLVMLFTTTVYTTGFALLKVPYGVVAGLVGGILSLLPYGQISGPILAIAFCTLEGQVTGEIDIVRALVLPLAVYAVMQGLESFIVTPLVQGVAMRLHPLAILVCLVAGGSLGGILGVFLAIPMTASVWLIAQTHLFPRWLRWAEDA
ncbi:MAG: AI-2E family transporter [Myxococcales bacterium]|nr:AI-2E family transporter [Myxococcales bacterium]